MKLRNRSVFFAVVAISTFIVVYLSNCKHEPILKVITTDTSQGGTVDDTSICFERDILPIFVTNCAKSGCHDSITQTEEKMYNSYVGITKEGIKAGDPANSDLYKELSTGKMSWPQYGNLNEEQKKLIARWIKEGAKNGTNCPTKCDTSVYTYSAAVKPLMEKYCVGCHKPGSINGNTDLSNYDSVKSSAASNKLLASVKRSVSWMPSGGKKLSDCQIIQLQKWIDAGMKND